MLGEVREGVLDYAKGADALLRRRGSYSMSLLECVDLGGEEVLAVLEVQMTGASSGAPASMPNFSRVSVRDGLVVAILEYQNRAEALGAGSERE